MLTRASKTILKYFEIIVPVNRGLRTFRSLDLWIESSILLTRRPCWFLELRSRFHLPFYFIFFLFSDFLKATCSYLYDFSADLCCHIQIIKIVKTVIFIIWRHHYMYELYCQWHITVLCMLPLALDSNKSPTHEYDNGIYSSNLKEDRVNEVRQCKAVTKLEAHMSFESKPSTQVVKRCAFISIFVRSLAQLSHLGKSRKVFPKTGRWHSDIPETFSRLFPDFIISGHEAGDFPETISRSISWVPGVTPELQLFVILFDYFF